MLECPGTGLVGLAIAKRVGSKPQRNRARRRLREALARVELSSDRDRIFIGGSRLLTRPLPELIAQLEDLLGSAPNGPREPEAP
jgi:ribonuclease P protein component